MTGHPLLLSVAAVDVLTLAALGAGLLAAFPAAIRWNPGSDDRGQLALERRVEAGSVAGHAASALLFLSTVLLVAAVSLALPGTIAGAMCGTGVLQSLGEKGVLAIGFRLLALLALSMWQVLDQLNNSLPETPLTRTGARGFLALSPAVFLGIVETQRALWGLDWGGAVDCCARIYDPVAGLDIDSAGAGGPLRMGAFFLLSAGAAGLAWTIRSATALRAWRCRLLAATVLVWVPAAFATLVHDFSPAIFGVLAHPCPWCLFLPQHQMVGFVLFGALALAAREGALLPVIAWAARKEDGLAGPAGRRSSKAAGRVLAALVVFLLFGAGPTLLWRIRFGVWISG